MSSICYIGLGSNQADPIGQVLKACEALGQVPRTRLARRSSLYRSAPLGPQDQPPYINAVAELDTELTPLELLDQLQRIELDQGRERKAERWGPRTLDLDMLLFGEQVIDSPRLQVPHYHMQARAFVLYPLAELAADLALPDGTRLSQLLDTCPADGLERLDATAQG